jgi:hypothetical protein
MGKRGIIDEISMVSAELLPFISHMFGRLITLGYLSEIFVP